MVTVALSALSVCASAVATDAEIAQLLHTDGNSQCLGACYLVSISSMVPSSVASGSGFHCASN